MALIIPIILKVHKLFQHVFLQDSQHLGKHLYYRCIFFLKIVFKNLELQRELSWIQVLAPTTHRLCELGSFTTLGLNVFPCKTGVISNIINLIRLLGGLNKTVCIKHLGLHTGNTDQRSYSVAVVTVHSLCLRKRRLGSEMTPVSQALLLISFMTFDRLLTVSESGFIILTLR